MEDRTEDTVDVDLQRGGMLEFQETGVYPEYLIVTSKKWGADGSRASQEIKKRDCSI